MAVRRSAVRKRRHMWSLVVATLMLAATVALLAFGALGAVEPGALSLLPALVLAVVLLAGAYPGERLIERWGRARKRRRRAMGLSVVSARPDGSRPRGGRLIAASLAGRAPPALAAG
jgi:uncharacterized membrane protein YfcA